MTSHAEYGLKTPGTEVAKAFKNELKGKNSKLIYLSASVPRLGKLKLGSTVLVTGIGPKGIGGATARAFASQEPALLILASRTQEKIDSVATNIRAAHPNLRVETVLLDLASQKSIRKAAGEIQKLTDKLDILVNNAAAVVYTRSKTAEGIELQFGVNHVGPFLLTNLLMPLLLKSAETGSPGSTRIVSLTSAGHRLSPVRFSDYNLEGKPIPKEEEPFSPMPPMFAKSAEDGYNGTVAYAQSKTANILFTVYLQEHLHKRGIASYVLHPGSTISNTLPSPLEPCGHSLINHPEQASTRNWAVTRTKLWLKNSRMSRPIGGRKMRAVPPPWLRLWILA
jgi:NAD(P)-dependent dehydrogenase (short-subunit alcohol dehydrogenase family)